MDGEPGVLAVGGGLHIVCTTMCLATVVEYISSLEHDDAERMVPLAYQLLMSEHDSLLSSFQQVWADVLQI